MTKSPPVTRREFVQRYMRECGLTYVMASKVYESMCRTFEDAIVKGSTVRIGQLGCLTPTWLPAREIHMHFKVVKGRKVDRGVHRTYNMEGRYTFKFRLYEHFMETHQLKWFQEVPGI